MSFYADNPHDDYEEEGDIWVITIRRCAIVISFLGCVENDKFYLFLLLRYSVNFRNATSEISTPPFCKT